MHVSSKFPHQIFAEYRLQYCALLDMDPFLVGYPRHQGTTRTESMCSISRKACTTLEVQLASGVEAQVFRDWLLDGMKQNCQLAGHQRDQGMWSEFLLGNWREGSLGIKIGGG